MHLDLRLKLFLLLLVVSVLLVACMAVVVQWSFQRGFLELVEARHAGRIEAVTARLELEHREAGGWQRLRESPARWVAILYPERPGLARRLARRAPSAAAGESLPWPPHRRQAHAPPRPRPLEHRMMLLDAGRELLIGRPQERAGAREYPLTVEDSTVGWLAVSPGPALNAIADLRFVERQRSVLLAVAGVMVLAAAALALPLAGAMTRRISDMARAARSLSLGDHSVRVDPGPGDELGRLARDLNELARTLGRNEASRRAWVADVSHELRTPLAVLRGELEALQDGLRPLDARAVDSLHSDALRLGRLVDDLYDLARADLGALQYRKRDLDLAEQLHRDVALLRPHFEQRGIRVSIDPPAASPVDGRWQLHGDPDRLSQLFTNLLSNSLRYTDAGGELRVALRDRGGSLLLTFQDSAPGVPEAELPRLFERFHRVEASRSRDHGGAGLGLAICERIVAAHGGTIQAQASPLGGLMITLTLPRESRE